MLIPYIYDLLVLYLSKILSRNTQECWTIKIKRKIQIFMVDCMLTTMGYCEKKHVTMMCLFAHTLIHSNWFSYRRTLERKSGMLLLHLQYVWVVSEKPKKYHHSLLFFVFQLHRTSLARFSMLMAVSHLKFQLVTPQLNKSHFAE